jgi:hypothetical protein|tara:strand:- start:1178 stop:1564 length:387 start_codon:yes stop_codon:yes gene_type:complete
MFDLNYYKKLKNKKYVEEPSVELIIIYEDIILNKKKYNNIALKELFNYRIKNLEKIINEKQILKYPALYSEHLKNKINYKNIAKTDDNLYLIFFCKKINKFELITNSNETENIKKHIVELALKNANLL